MVKNIQAENETQRASRDKEWQQAVERMGVHAVELCPGVHVINVVYDFTGQELQRKEAALRSLEAKIVAQGSQLS